MSAFLARRLPWIAFWLAAAALSLHGIADPDTWWHLKAGERIVAERAVPRVDPFTYTTPDAPWVDHGWLFQVALHAVRIAAGEAGVATMTALLALAAVALFLLPGRGRRSAWAGALIALVAVSGAASRFQARPELATFLCLGALLALLESRRAVWLAPPLLGLWANLHGGFPLGFLVLGAWTLEALLRRDRAPSLLAVTAASVAATLVNPYGFGLWERAVRELEDPALRTGILEWAPPFGDLASVFSTSYLELKAMAALLAIALVADFRRFRVAHVIVAAALLAGACASRRAIALFCLAALPLVRLHLPGGPRRLPALPLALGAAAACLWLGARAVTGERYRAPGRLERFGLQPPALFFPRQATAFLLRARPAGRLFHDYFSGGWLIDRLPGLRPVFIDGRILVPALLDRYQRMIVDRAEWERAVEEFDLGAALLTLFDPNHGPLIRRLAEDPRWAPVFLDAVAVVFVRDRPEHRELIARGRIDLARVAPELTDVVLPPAGGLELPGVALLRRRVDRPLAHFYLGWFFQNLGRVDASAAHYRSALAVDPGLRDAETGLGYLAFERGRKLFEAGDADAAEGAFREAFRQGFAPGPSLANVGRCLLRRGDREGARAALREAARLAPGVEWIRRELEAAERLR
jgi:hypothetical protein